MIWTLSHILMRVTNDSPKIRRMYDVLHSRGSIAIASHSHTLTFTLKWYMADHSLAINYRSDTASSPYESSYAFLKKTAGGLFNLHVR